MDHWMGNLSIIGEPIRLKNRRFITDNENLLHFKTDNGMHMLYIDEYKIFETRDIQIIHDILSYMEHYKNVYDNIHEKIKEIESSQYELDDGLFIKIEPSEHKGKVAVLYKNSEHNTIDRIGDRTLEYTSPVNAWIYDECTISGHTQIEYEFQRMGYGFKLYQAIEEMLGVKSVPSNAVGLTGRVSNEASSLWDKIYKHRQENGEVIKSYVEERVKKHSAMLEFLKIQSHCDYERDIKMIDSILVYKNYKDIITQTIQSAIELSKDSIQSFGLTPEEYIELVFPPSIVKENIEAIQYYLEQYHSIEIRGDEIMSIYQEIQDTALNQLHSNDNRLDGFTI